MVNKLPVVQFLSEIILVISNQTCAAHFFNLEIMHNYHDYDFRPNCTPHSSIIIFKSTSTAHWTGKKTMHEIYQSHALYKALMQF